MSAATLLIPLVVVFVIGLIVLSLLWPSLAEGVRTAKLEGAQAELRPCLGFPGLEEGRLEEDRLVGTFEGHDVTLSFGSRRVGDATVRTLRYALQLPGRPYSQSLPSAWDLGDSLGDQGAQAEGVQRALAHLGKIPDLELMISQGWLVLSRAVTGYAKGATSLSSAYRAMSQLAPFLTRSAFQASSPRSAATIKVQAREAPTKAEEDVNLPWTERSGGEPLCPYCRDEIGAAGLTLSRCETCHTVHHSECLEELGHCAIFGCQGQRAEALRA